MANHKRMVIGSNMTRIVLVISIFALSSVQASIDGSGQPLSIDGSGVPLSIDGSGTPQSIDGSGTPLSIDGSGIPLSIDGSGVPFSIDGSGIPLSIDGSGVPLSIDGSGIPLSIDGSGVPLSIDGSGIPLSIDGSGVPFSIDGSGVPLSIDGSGAPMLALGPIEKAGANSYSVLGYELKVKRQANAIKEGDYLAMTFSRFVKNGKGARVDIYRLNTSFVFGASPVMLFGIVQKVGHETGRITIQGVDVEYTTFISDPRATEISVGNPVAVFGVYPQPGGEILAHRLIKF